MKRLFALLFLLPLAALAQSPGVGLDSLPSAGALGGTELLFGYQAGTGGSGATICARGWCPVSITPAQIKTYIGDTGAPPAGSQYQLQINGGGGNFGYISNVAGGILIGQTSGAPIFYAPSGDLTMTNGGVFTVVKVNGLAVPASEGCVGTNSSSQFIAGSCGGSPAFSAITSATNTTAAMVVGSGASLATSGSGTNAATSAPLSGVSGLGTGIATALAVNVGTAGAPVVNGGALGTPSSGVGTNLTGTASALNIGGTAGNLSGTPALPNGTTATTQTTGDNTTKIATDAFVLANAGSSSSITPGTTTVVGATAPCLIDNSTSTTMGCAALAGTLALNSGVLGTTAPSRTVTSSPTVAAGDMGGIILTNVSGGGTVTIPAISSTVFAAGMTTTITNYSASTAAISTTPTVNAGGGCVSGTGIPAGATWELSSNGTTLDCNQTGGSSITQTIASGTATLGTSAISSGTCAPVVAVAATGVATTDTINASFNGDPTVVVGYEPSSSGMLTIITYPTAGDINVKVCNNTANSVTPGAVTLNWHVLR